MMPLIKTEEMSACQLERVQKFVQEHGITDPVLAARFFWNQLEGVWQVEEIVLRKKEG